MSDETIRVGNCEIIVVEGDITKIDANAIITSINSAEDWDGGVDNAIFDVARNHFHDQARKHILNDLDAVFAQGKRDMPWNGGRFDNVIFVVDDLKSPLNEVVESGLFSADYHNMKEILLPAMRTGVMLGQIELSMNEVVDEIIMGIRKHFAGSPDSVIEKITIVVYSNKEFRSAMTKKLSDLK